MVYCSENNWKSKPGLRNKGNAEESLITKKSYQIKSRNPQKTRASGNETKEAIKC